MSKKDYDLKYQKENVKRIYLTLNKEHDKDIIEWLESVDNVNGTIKQVLRTRAGYLHQIDLLKKKHGIEE